ncbi:MAG: peptidylprolyl isomerase [Oscillospiraceae bacterium]
MSEKKEFIRDPYSKRKMRTYFQISMIAVAFVIVFAVFMFLTSGKKSAIDYSASDFVQFTEPADDAPVVVFETTEGTFKAVLYEDKAPEYCEFFEKLVNDGYFNDTYVCTILKSQDGVTGGFIGGSKTKDGKSGDDTDMTMLDIEVSPDLLSTKGALGSLVKQGGTFSNSKAGSVFTVINDVVNVQELDENSKAEDVNGFNRVSEQFKKYGGVPNYLQMYTFFGQVYDGWEVLDKINASEIVDEKASDDVEDKNFQPTKEIKFTKVYMSTYGENKENGYNIPLKDESGSQQDESSEE